MSKRVSISPHMCVFLQHLLAVILNTYLEGVHIYLFHLLLLPMLALLLALF